MLAPFNKIVGLKACNIIKKRLQRRSFSCKHCEVIQNSYFEKVFSPLIVLLYTPKCFQCKQCKFESVYSYILLVKNLSHAKCPQLCIELYHLDIGSWEISFKFRQRHSSAPSLFTKLWEQQSKSTQKQRPRFPGLVHICQIS